MPLYAIVPLVVLAALLGAFAVRTLMSRTLRRIDETAHAIVRGDYKARVQYFNSGVMGELAEDVDALGASIERAVNATSQERERLTSTLNASIDGVAAVDRELNVLFANDALHRLLDKRGEPENDVVGHPLVWSVPDEQVLDNVRASRDNAKPSVTLIERTGRRFYQVATTPITNGGTWAVLVVIHDLTDVRRAELQRRDFVGNVSHELRTPLARCGPWSRRLQMARG